MILDILFYTINHWTISRTDVNVALFQNVKFCKEVMVSDVVVNGDKIVEEDIYGDCFPVAYLQIDLSRKYFVHYVIVYEGRYETYEGQLDYFTIYVELDEIQYLCAEYPYRSKRNSTGMRVNCRLTSKAVKIVKIYSKMNKGFKITEVEIFTIGMGGPSGHIELTRGCLSNFHSQISAILISFRKCQRFCFSRSYHYIAIMRNKTCHCGNEYKKENEIETKRCNIKCGGVDQYCGGYRVYSLYLIKVNLPIYFGCKAYDKQAENAIIDDQMTISKCILLCQNNNHAILKEGSTCMCENVELRGISESQMCNITCSGSPDLYCGGRNYVSVYKTCTENMTFLSCSEMFRCNNTWDEYGVCQSSCDDNFYGVNCLQRESKCRTQNPCINKSYTECNFESEIFTCPCLSGFSQTEEGPCTDIDECVDEPCNTVTSICKNVIGSYYCQCKINHHEINDDVCISSDGSSPNSIQMSLLLKLFLAACPAIMLISMFAFVICRRKKKKEKQIHEADIKSANSGKDNEPSAQTPAVVFKKPTKAPRKSSIQPMTSIKNAIKNKISYDHRSFSDPDR